LSVTEVSERVAVAPRGHGLAHAPEDRGQHPEAHRRLMIQPVGRPAGEQPAERAQRGRLVLVAPQQRELRGIRVERRPERLDRQRDRALGQVGSAATGQRGIGHQRRRGRGAVDQRHRLARLELEPFGELAEQMAQRGDLSRAAVPPRRDRRQRAAVEHGRDRRGQRRTHRGVPADEVGQPREDDPAHHPLGQRLAERRCRPEPRRPGLAGAIGEHRASGVARARGHAVQKRTGVLGQARRDEPLEGRPAAAHPLLDLGAQSDRLALPRHPPEGVERQVRATADDDGHARQYGAPWLGTEAA
jgi:hypothetical protein